MSKLKTLVKVPTILDGILLLVLLARLVIQTAIYAVTFNLDFGRSFTNVANPFMSTFVFTEGYPGDVFWWVGTKWQLIYLLVVLALVLAGLRKSAAIAMIGSVLLSSVVPPLAWALDSPLGLSSFFSWYDLSGTVSMPGYYFSGGLLFLEQIYLGFGLLLALAFGVFYLIRQLPRKSRASRTVTQVTQGETMNSKAEYCSKCGAAASDGDFCSKCGNNLFPGNLTTGIGSIPRTSPLAIAAIISVFFVSWVGLVLGYLARREIRDSRGTLNGEGMAKAAILIGWIFTGLAVLAAIIWGIVIGIAAGNAYSQ
jgi:hypothetical protein